MNRSRVVVAAVCLAITMGAAAAVGVTTASWTDETYFQADASAGTWEPAPESLWECRSIETTPPLDQAECWVEPFNQQPATWNVSQNYYDVAYNVVTDSETAFRWEVSPDIETKYLWQGLPILSTGGTPGVELFPPDGVVPGSQGNPSWQAGAFQLSRTCAASPASSLPTTAIRGIGGVYETAYVVATRPWQTQNLLLQAYAAGAGGSAWGTGLAPSCAAVADAYDDPIVCYNAAAPQQTDCVVGITLWDAGTRELRWDVSAPLEAATVDPFVWEVRFDLSRTSTDGPFAGIPSGFAVSNACVVWSNNEDPTTFLPIVKLRGVGDTQSVTPGGDSVGPMVLSEGLMSLSDPLLKCP